MALASKTKHLTGLTVQPGTARVRNAHQVGAHSPLSTPEPSASSRSSRAATARGCTGPARLHSVGRAARLLKKGPGLREERSAGCRYSSNVDALAPTLVDLDPARCDAAHLGRVARERAAKQGRAETVESCIIVRLSELVLRGGLRATWELWGIGRASQTGCKWGK